MRAFRNLTALQMVRKLKNNGYKPKYVVKALREYLKKQDTQCGFIFCGILIEHCKATNTYDLFFNYNIKGDVFNEN